MNKSISIAIDFSRFPAGRYESDGLASGETFREDYLAKALSKPDIEVLTVTFDGVAGFGSSFLEEAFGGLVRNNKFEKDFLDVHLRLETSEPELEDYVRLARRYIDEASEVF